jgi:hypothetical protein
MKKILSLLGMALIALVLISSTEKGNNDKKIIVCHIPPGNPANAHDIEISVNALPAHLAHGDFVGGCHSECDGLCP